MELWHYSGDGKMICNNCGSEVWYLAGGYICTGDNKPSREGCFNEDEEDDNGRAESGTK